MSNGSPRENLLRKVIEKEQPCPTLLDLDRFAQLQATASPNDNEPTELQVIVDHLSTCPECDRIFQGLLTLAKAAPKAAKRASKRVS